MKPVAVLLLGGAIAFGAYEAAPAQAARPTMAVIIDASVDVVKLIDQVQMTDAEVAAVVETAHRNGKPVIAHAHRMDEPRMGLKHGVDEFEHTGLGTGPGDAEDVLQQLRERNSALYWTPTLSPLFTRYETGTRFPERLDDTAWREGMPREMATEIRTSLEHIAQLPYYALFPSRHRVSFVPRIGLASWPRGAMPTSFWFMATRWPT